VNIGILGDEYFSVLRCYFHDGEAFRINGRSVPDALDAKECDQVFLTNSIEIDDHIGKSKILLINSMGQEVKRFELDEIVKEKINVADLNKGIYFIQIHIDEKIYTRKILKR